MIWFLLSLFRFTHSRALPPLLYSPPPPPPFFRMLFFSFVYFVIKSMTKCNVILLVKMKSNELSCSSSKEKRNERKLASCKTRCIHAYVTCRDRGMTLQRDDVVHSHYKSIGFFDISSFYEFRFFDFPLVSFFNLLFLLRFCCYFSPHTKKNNHP